ncbi:DUF6483 family protein [Marinicrinis lubricantis]|uniref:DUF6483 family protein n=1 Tax=Marinicrinis lubricantis TaxID=2086470 RepID=A0ABW1IVM0_9BACL
MFQRDYILRLIEQMSQFIGTVVFKLKQERKFEEALDEMDGMLHRLSLPNGKVLRTISVEDVLQMLEKDGQTETEKIGAIASILKEQADIFDRMGNEEGAWAASVKSLHYHLVWHRLAGRLDPYPDINSLYRTLSEYVLPSRITEEMALYYERIGRYELSENLWYELCKKNDPDALNKAKQFYERLLCLDDALLESANLPRAEVEEGLEDIHERIQASFGG